MSIFSKIKNSKNAAKKHKEKAAEKEAVEEVVAVKAPYKHIPTHAAVDALSGAPSTWKADDRSKIREHHKRRSQMVISRTGSSLSTVSHMNAAAGPGNSDQQQQQQFPRSNSYNSYNPTWFERGDQSSYGNEQPAQKRYKSSRGHSYHDSGIGPSIGPSPLASNLQSEETSPVVSSGNSTSSKSSDPLEIVNASSDRKSSRPRGPQGNVYAERDIFQRLHTSTGRKLGEAPIMEVDPEAVARRKLTKSQAQVQVSAEKQEKRKSRFSFMGKKNATAIEV